MWKSFFPFPLQVHYIFLFTFLYNPLVCLVLPSGMFTDLLGLVLYRTCAHTYSCSEFMGPIIMSCPEVRTPHPPALQILSSLFLSCSLTFVLSILFIVLALPAVKHLCSNCCPPHQYVSLIISDRSTHL